MVARYLVCLFLFCFLTLPAYAAGGYRRVLVWLEGEPLAELYARNSLPFIYQPLRLNTPDMEGQRAMLRSQRGAVQYQLEQLGFIADGETDIVLHSLIGRMPEENIEAARTIRGIRLLRPVREYRPLLDTAVPLIGAVAAWIPLGGEAKAGAGMKIAIVDTGIDISNPMLQDTRLAVPTGFPKGEKDFTNSKVIVARNYIALLGDPRDPANAMDREGHGTFVAAITAGRRAIAPFAELVGVAPAAQLGNYRIFGSPLNQGATTDAVIVAAINDAVADGMNVVNLSLGGAALDTPGEEPVPQAVAAAVKAGVVVVIAAGNEGDVCTAPCPSTIGDPADSPEGITVGASSNSRIFANALSVVNGPTAVPDNLKRAPAVPAYLQAGAAVGPAAVYRVSNACRAIAPPDDVKGKIALVQDDSRCGRSAKITNLANGGAVAALVYRRDDSAPGRFYFIGKDSYEVAPPIPAFQMYKSDGDALATLTGAAGQAQATLDANVSTFPFAADVVALWSSRGPSNDLELKPDLVAPGTHIYSAAQANDAYGGLYNGTQFDMADGTSAAAPFVAGAAALVKQAHPTWTPAQVKSALVNTANTAVNQGGQSAPITGVGAGRLDVARALAAAAAFDPVGLSFGSYLLRDSVKVQRTLKITNLGANPETFSIEVGTRTDLAGASVSVDPATTPAVAPGGSATVQVTFQGPPSVKGSASTDGRLRIHANNSGMDYVAAFWGQVVDSTQTVHVRAIRGDGASANVSTVLPRPLVLRVSDNDIDTGSEQAHTGIAGVPVHFDLLDGGGSLSATDVTTDFAGLAATWLRLPDTPGVVHVRATIADRVRETGCSSSALFVTCDFFTITARPAPAVPAGPAGVVNAASYSTSLAPGGMFSIFGTGLAAGTAAAGGVPLPQTLASTQVLFNGQPTALFYVSPTQINAQAPFELAGVKSAEVRISVTGALSAPVTVPLSVAAPGIFTVSQDGKGAAVVLHGATYAPVTASAPARPGETVLLFASGLGAVQPPVSTGAAAPSQPAATTANTTTVTIGSAAARVLFSGLAPGFVGLYQVNFEVPTGVAVGDAVPLTISVANVSSNQVALPVR